MRRLLSLTVVLSIASSIGVAQAPPEAPKPEKEHEWLKQFEGEWETESESTGSPDQPAMKCKGKMSSRMIGGFWVLSELTMSMDQNQVTAIQTIGYDPAAKKYVGTWLDSSNSYLWKYEGSVDESGRILTLEAEGPNFQTGKGMLNYRDIYEMKDKDHILTRSQIEGPDGKWVTFMTGHARRKNNE